MLMGLLLTPSLLQPTLRPAACTAQAKREWEEREKERQAAAGVTAVNEPEREEQFVAYVPLPSDQELEQRILQVKKANLLAKYASESIQREQEEAKALLNKR